MGRLPAWRVTLALGFLGVALSACTKDQIVVESGLPGLSAGAEVELLAERHGYLDTTVKAGGQDYRFFFPATDICRGVIAAPDSRFRLDGVLSSLETNDASCEAEGVLALAQWRGRQGRASRNSGARALITRDRIEYRVVYTDDDVFLARGRFRLAGEIGWPGGVDSFAIFPNTEPCAGVKEKVRGSMEFREAGEPFTVLDGSIRCPVLGFARPLPEGQPRSE